MGLPPHGYDDRVEAKEDAAVSPGDGRKDGCGGSSILFF